MLIYLEYSHRCSPHLPQAISNFFSRTPLHPLLPPFKISALLFLPSSTSCYQLPCSLFKSSFLYLLLAIPSPATPLLQPPPLPGHILATRLSMQITQPSTHCLAHSWGGKKKKKNHLRGSTRMYKVVKLKKKCSWN